MEEWNTIFSNTHHVQDNENSGHRVAPQEDTQSDAEMTTFSIYPKGLYLTQEKYEIIGKIHCEMLPETVNGAGCLAYLAIHSWTVLLTEKDRCVSLSRP